MLAAVLQPFQDSANHAQPPPSHDPEAHAERATALGARPRSLHHAVLRFASRLLQARPDWAGLLRDQQVWELAFGARCDLKQSCHGCQEVA